MRIPVPTSRAARKAHLSFWDVVWALVCPVLALYLRDAQILADRDWATVGSYWALSTAFTLLAFYVFRVHEEIPRYFSVHNTVDIARAVLLAEFMTFLTLFVLTRLDGIPRSTPLIHGLLLASGIVAIRMFACILRGEDESVQRHFQCGRIILIGANRFSYFFIKLLNAYSPEQQRVIGVLDERPAMTGRAISGVRILGTPQHLEAIIDEFLVHGCPTEKVVIAGEPELLSQEAAFEVDRVCRNRQIELSYLPQLLGTGAFETAECAAPVEPLTEAKSFALSPFFKVKRWIDVAGSLLLAILLVPLFAMVALLVLLDVGSPVVFWQRRLGRNGRAFLLYKFRTLAAPFDAHGRPVPESGRLSMTGRFLRASRLDELPQLLNVLAGDMSLIGPRPLLPEDQPANTAIRLSVRPGITGWAQVNGAKLVTREDKEKLDEWYVRNASLRLDLQILIMSLKVVFKLGGSSEEAMADAHQAQSRNSTTTRTAAIQQVIPTAVGSNVISYDRALANNNNTRVSRVSGSASSRDAAIS